MVKFAEGKNPALLALGGLCGILAVIMFATFPLHVASERIINSAINGAIGGALAGGCIALVQQKKKTTK